MPFTVNAIPILGGFRSHQGALPFRCRIRRPNSHLLGTSGRAILVLGNLSQLYFTPQPSLGTPLSGPGTSYQKGLGISRASGALAYTSGVALHALASASCVENEQCETMAWSHAGT